MRISDWSSDVCSSDLQQGVATFLAPPALEHRHRGFSAAPQYLDQIGTRCEVAGRQLQLRGARLHEILQLAQALLLLATELVIGEQLRCRLLARDRDQRKQAFPVSFDRDRKRTRLNSSH